MGWAPVGMPLLTVLFILINRSPRRVPSGRVDVTPTCTLLKSAGESCTLMTWELEVPIAFLQHLRGSMLSILLWFYFFTAKGFTGLTLLRGGKHGSHNESISPMTVQFLCSLWTIFILRDCSKYWLRCHQMNRAKARKTNPSNYFQSFIRLFVILRNPWICYGSEVKLICGKE